MQRRAFRKNSCSSISSSFLVPTNEVRVWSSSIDASEMKFLTMGWCGIFQLFDPDLSTCMRDRSPTVADDHQSILAKWWRGLMLMPFLATCVMARSSSTKSAFHHRMNTTMQFAKQGRRGIWQRRLTTRYSVLFKLLLLVLFISFIHHDDGHNGPRNLCARDSPSWSGALRRWTIKIGNGLSEN